MKIFGESAFLTQFAKDEREEGMLICAELIQEMQEIQGVRGAHLMAPRQEEAMAEVIERTGIVEQRPATLK
jgi:methylenetetrahydrofolate reductase (NADH)